MARSPTVSSATPVPSPTRPLTEFRWEDRAPSPIGRFEAQGGVVNGKLYVFGGFIDEQIRATTRSDVYDPASDSWAPLAEMPEPVTHAPAAIDGTTFYLVGGYVGDHPGPASAHVWKYDTLTDRWTAGPPLPEPRGAGATVILGRELHFFGGTDRSAASPDDVDRSSHFVLDLDDATSWSTRAPLPNPRNHLGGAASGGRVLAIGGQHGRDETAGNQAQVDAYDSRTDTWTRVADLPVAKGHLGVTVLRDTVVVCGGTINGNLPADDCHAFDAVTERWSALPRLPAGRKTPVLGVIDGAIIVAQGNGPTGPATTTTWLSVPR